MAGRPTRASPLRVRVSQDGAATRMKLVLSSRSNVLETATRECVKSWRFTPARRAGNPVRVRVIVPVVFPLTSRS